MADINIFTGDAFSMTTMLMAIEKTPFKPTMLGDMNIFADFPVTTKTVWIEERDGTLSLIQTSPRGSPLPQRTTEKRTARAFGTVRVAKGDRLNAPEISSIRAFGSDTELMSAQAEVARRLSGPVGMQSEIEYTWENMRLGAVQGIVVDADSSVINNWYTEFGISQPSEIAFNITGIAAGTLRTFIATNIVRPMMRAAKGMWLPSTVVTALCGDTFFDQLVSHSDVRTTYLNWVAAAELRPGTAFSAFNFGGVNWINYRGSDDNSTIAVAVDKAKFFPVGAPGMFRRALAPADEFFPFVNTPGRPLYPIIAPDPTERQAYVDIELYSYPLFICTRPDVLLSGRAGS
jgi:hypothetical protein